MRSKFITTLIFIFISFFVVAQDPLPGNSTEIIATGIKFAKEGKFEQAIQTYAQVNRNDSNYATSLIESAIAHRQLKEYQKSIDKCHEALKYSSEEQDRIYNIMGASYNDMGNYQQSILIYKEAIHKFPKNYLLFFNLGLTHIYEDEINNAVTCFRSSVDLNPFHASGHYFLGLSAAGQGRYVPAFLSLSMFLILENDSERSTNAIQVLEEMSGGSYEIPVDIDFPADSSFRELSMIVRSRIALMDDYESWTRLYDPYFKQMQVICEKLPGLKQVNDFWQSNYIDFFINLVEQDYFELFCYNAIANVGSDKVSKFLEKKENKIDKFYSFVENDIYRNLSDKEMIYKGKTFQAAYWLNENNELIAAGKTKKDTQGNFIRTGPWLFFYSSGKLHVSGRYSETGEKTGQWIQYYPDGKIKESAGYKNGLLDGKYTFYHPNGQKQSQSTYTAGLIDSIFHTYYNSGEMQTCQKYRNGELNGKYISYFENGDIKSVYHYRQGKTDSIAREYYPKGILKTVYYFNNGLLDGLSKHFEKNGNLLSRGFYKDDQAVGQWSWFYPDGTTQSTLNFDSAGQAHGPVRTFYENGQVENEYQYKNDDIHGAWNFYTETGRKRSQYNFENGVMNDLTCFDRNGDTLHDEKTQMGEIHFYSYFPEGQIKTKGQLSKGQKEGKWTFYYQNGNIQYIEHYKNDTLEGTYREFYKNGEIKYKYNFENGLVDGYYTYYRLNGNNGSEGWYKDDEAEGQWLFYTPDGSIDDKNYYLKGKYEGYQEYYLPNSNLWFEEYYKNSLLNYIIFYDTLGLVSDTAHLNNGTGKIDILAFNGRKKATFRYKSGKLNGPFFRYHTNGKIKTKGFYCNGKIDSIFQKYYEDGSLFCQGHYLLGDETGTWTWYHEKGKPKKTGTYYLGKKVGKWRYFYQDGGLKEEIHYKNGEKHGFSILYAKNELPAYRKTYLNGTLTGFSYPDSAYSFMKDIPLPGETGKILAFYPNGNKSVTETYKYGYLNGERDVFSPDGNLIRSENYKDGQLNGTVTEYDENGRKKSKKQYYFDELNGKCSFYYSNGNVEHTEYYLMDKKHGTWKYFDETGTLLKTKTYRYDERCDK
jgi:uncharacterized protein